MTVDVIPSPTLDVLRYAGVPDGRDGERLGRLVVLLAQRYGLAPELGHVEVIRTKNGPKVYITRDGWLDIAHRSGQLDGVVVDDEWSDDEGHKARVSVWRRDMAHPFTFGACYRHAEAEADKNEDPASKALARAERRALRRAFRVPIISGERDLMTDDDADTAPELGADLSRASVPSSEQRPTAAVVDPPPGPPPPSALTEPIPPSVTATVDRGSEVARQASAHRLIGSLSDVERTAFLLRHDIDSFGEAWPEAALIDAARTVAEQ